MEPVIAYVYISLHVLPLLFPFGSKAIIIILLCVSRMWQNWKSARIYIYTYKRYVKPRQTKNEKEIKSQRDLARLLDFYLHSSLQNVYKTKIKHSQMETAVAVGHFATVTSTISTAA